MKKKILVFLMILAVGFNHYYNLPDYRIINAMSFCTNTTRDTNLTVIIYKYWDIDSIISEIEAEHNKINGIPTTLKLDIYLSQKHMQQANKPFKTVQFRY